MESRALLSAITVNSLADNLTAGDGLVTLREAIAAANADTTTDLGETASGADQIRKAATIPEAEGVTRPCGSLREAAAMVEVQLAQRAERRDAASRRRRLFHAGFCGIVQSSNLSPGTREKCLALLVNSKAFRVNATLAIFRSLGPMLGRRCFSSKNLMPAA